MAEGTAPSGFRPLGEVKTPISGVPKSKEGKWVLGGVTFDVNSGLAIDGSARSLRDTGLVDDKGNKIYEIERFAPPGFKRLTPDKK